MKLSLGKKPENDEHPDIATLIKQLGQKLEELTYFAKESAKIGEDGCPKYHFASFELELKTRLMALGRLVCTLFLTLAENELKKRLPTKLCHGDRTFTKESAKPRSLNTLFGVMRYWRTYMRCLTGSEGYHPLDLSVGLTRGRTSFNLLMSGVMLALKLSFDEAHSTLGHFVETPPSIDVLEKASLGLGRFTAEFFEKASAPTVDGPDGEVLVIMIDSKGVPTATEKELKKRRVKRVKRLHSKSKRHRGRDKRQRCPRTRRKKGDKSKNARMATVLVMYTLRREGDLLIGPLNVFRYASMASKQHAFKIAIREAKKRGFKANDDGSFESLPDQKLVHILVDGDQDLDRYTKEYFPGANFTIDVMHVLGYIYSAAKAIFKEKSCEMDQWFSTQKERLYNGELDVLLEELHDRLDSISKRGPGTKRRREKLEKVINYIDKRQAHLNYSELIEADMDIATGMVEGAVKYVVAKRFDHGGMRWIRERAEALLQLRCIAINGQWEDFLNFVHNKIMEAEIAPIKLLQDEPAPLPDIAQKAA